MFVGVGVGPLLALGPAGKAGRNGFAVPDSPHPAELGRARLADGDDEGVAVGVIGHEINLACAQSAEVGLGARHAVVARSGRRPCAPVVVAG